MPSILRLKEDLPYPIEIVSIDCQEGSNVEKKKPIFTYKYSKVNETLIRDEDDLSKTIVKKQKVEMIDTFDSPISGKVVKLNIKKNNKFNSFDPYENLIEVDEGCLHEIVYAGLCAVCGMTIDDEDDQNDNKKSKSDFVNRDKDTSKATLSYSNQQIKVSRSEVNRINREHMAKLKKSEKLILVVDLDQTVIHCGIDSSISDWVKTEKPKDVHKFCLEEDIRPWLQKQSVFIRKQYMNMSPFTKNWYYVKTRPFLKEFFAAIKDKFELHIYTMATRAYAEEIAKIIDPDGSLFQNRILSRDENKSLTTKSLDKVFPVEQDLVLIIDDRGDVWDWSPNLIRVIPYNYFQGIGDINSLNLPKQDLKDIPTNVDEKTHTERDDQLKILKTQLLDLHSSYYVKTGSSSEIKDRDIRKILRSKRIELLVGCKFVYEKMTRDIQRQIEQFGGRVTPNETTATHKIIDSADLDLKRKITREDGSFFYEISLGYLMRVCEKWEIEQDLVENRIKGLTPAPMIVGQKSINEENISEENVNEDALFKNGMSWLDENADGEGDEEFFSDMSSDSEDEENDKSKEDGSDSDDDLEKELELELS
ncbi:hypothetical protein FOG48_02905 [Hanseniaspora uvarum]|nr:hypothetical protein FOG48_02905 [Hanseniaspora uvarum]